MTVVLSLDLASVTGWAVGEPGGVPQHGSLRFAKPGSSHEAIFARAWLWANEKITTYRPNVIVWEAPLATNIARHTNINTTTLLYGLPAIVGAAAFLNDVHDVRKADTRDVRLHFIGQSPKRALAKPLVMRQCMARGWRVNDDNEGDACAVWSYVCSLIDPKSSIGATPLFSTGARR